MADVKKKCARHGCNEEYLESENNDDACTYHPGWPVFHDTMKMWTCCEKESWDWDEFMKFPGCEKGRHSDIKPVKPKKEENKDVAKIDEEKKKQEEASKKVQSIEQFNAQQKQAEEESAKAVPANKPQKPLVTAAGQYKCANMGCNKEYSPEDSNDTSCNYHSGVPLFRDIKKSWSCCNASSYDWDDFLKLPACKTGKHKPKMVDIKEGE